MKLSIIIPALNEERYIERTIQSIKNSDYKDCEIIVVANGCTDKTTEKARKADKIIVTKKKGVSMARNLGAKKAKGEMLIFLDADTTIENKTLEKIAAIKEPVIGTCYGQPNNNKLIARLFYLIKNRYTWTGNSNGIIYTNKNIYKKTGGFDESISRGEDWRFMRKAKKYAKLKTTGKVTNDMRRYEKTGYWNVMLSWAKARIKKSEYPVIR